MLELQFKAVMTMVHLPVTSAGAVTVADTTKIDFDSAASQTVVFTVTDGSNAVTESVTITFTDVVIAITAGQSGISS